MRKIIPALFLATILVLTGCDGTKEVKPSVEPTGSAEITEIGGPIELTEDNLFDYYDLKVTYKDHSEMDADGNVTKISYSFYNTLVIKSEYEDRVVKEEENYLKAEAEFDYALLPVTISGDYTQLEFHYGEEQSFAQVSSLASAWAENEHNRYDAHRTVTLAPQNTIGKSMVVEQMDATPFHDSYYTAHEDEDANVIYCGANYIDLIPELADETVYVTYPINISLKNVEGCLILGN